MAKLRNYSLTPGGVRRLVRDVVRWTRQGRRVRANVRRPNVAAGFYDEEGVFHPIRASFDYRARRAGEKTRRRPAKRRRTKGRR